jgi:hypothetical protein
MKKTNFDSLFEEFKNKVEEFSQDNSNRTNLYDYEKGFRDIMQEYEQKIFQSSLGEVSKSKNKKKR